MDFMRIVLLTAIALAVLANPARAQVSTGAEKTPLQYKYEAEDQARKDNEKAYDETMRRIRSTGPAPKTDPWRNVRPADTNKR
jgi:hypothetical protein